MSEAAPSEWNSGSLRKPFEEDSEEVRIIRAFAVCLGAIAPAATASVATFGPTNQTILMTGLGGNAAGDGQVRVTWGSCNFNGTNTVCTVTAPFTGIGAGGTISFVYTYPGNGPSGIVVASQTPGSNVLGPFALTVGSFVTTLTVNNGPTLIFNGEAPYFNYDQTAQCTGVTVCGTGQVGLAPGATIVGPVTGTFDPTPVIRTSLGVISAGQYGAFPSMAPGTWIEIYGSNLSTNPPPYLWQGGDFQGDHAPMTLNGTTVTIAGRKAFIDYVSPGQVNAQVPSDVPTGSQPVVVTTAGGTSVPYTAQVNSIQPGLLAPSQFYIGGQQYVVAQFPDGFTYVLPPGVTNLVPTKRARPGDVVVMYGIGFGPVQPDIPAGVIVRQLNTINAPVQIMFGGTPANVAYDGLTPPFLGLYQFNVTVPNIPASDTVPVTFSVGQTSSSQTMVIAIGN